MIRDVLPSDAERIRLIYNHYIERTDISFEECPVSLMEMQERLSQHSEQRPWLVCCDDEEVLGYACAVPWNERSAYQYTVETAIYLDPAARGRNLGTLLYRELIARLREQSVHLALAGIALPNAASIHLHEKLGFRKVAHFNEIGFRNGRWVDVGYWQLVLGRCHTVPGFATF